MLKKLLMSWFDEIKKKGERFFYPCIVSLSLIFFLIALGIIHWNRSALILSADLSKQIADQKNELAIMSEKIRFLQEQEGVTNQKQQNAAATIKESEIILSRLSKIKLEADAKIAKADAAAKNEQTALKNLADINAEISQNQLVLKQLNQEIKNKTEEQKKLSFVIDSVKKELEILQQQKNSLSAVSTEYKQMKRVLLEQNQQLASLKEKQASLKNEMQQAEIQYHSIQGDMEIARKQLSNLDLKKQTLAAIDSQVFSQRQVLQKLIAETEIWEKRKKEQIAMQARYEQMQKELSGFSAKKAVMQKEEQDLQAKKVILEANCKQQQRDLTVLTEQITALNTQKRELEKIVHDLPEIRSNYAVFLEKISDIKREQQNLQKTIAQYSGTCQVLQSSVKQKEEQVSALQLKISDLHKKNEEYMELNNQIINSRAKIEDLSKKQQLLESSIQELQGRKQALSANVKQKEERWGALQKQLDLVQKDLAAMHVLTAESAAAEKRLQQLKEETVVQGKVYEELLQKSAAERAALSAAVQSLKMEKDSLEADIARLKNVKTITSKKGMK